MPVVPAGAPRVRASRMGRRRAAVLIGVHVLMIAHVVQWMITGRTVSPIEPSEAMYTLNHGHLNAGFVFFAVAILATLVFGRFVCGWGCHFVAYQDLCGWALKKVGVKPRAFRARLLVFAPLALAIYMFVWPSVYRWFVGAPRPKLSNHLLTSDFWATFPGPVIAILTFLVAGMGIVYFLGAKGFCTYACPYGGVFGLADQAAPGRIRVTDDCEHCGHCTAVCTSNVRVHEEVARFGMVVDPGCMKCMDCVSVCPNDALYFGFTRSSKENRPAVEPAAHKVRAFEFSLAEELLMVLVGLAALLALRGLYDQIPLLLAMGLAAMTAFATLKLIRLAHDANVRWQNLSLKRGGRWSRAGVGYVTIMALWLGFTIHSGAIRYHVWQGTRLADKVALGDEVWIAGPPWLDGASSESRRLHADALMLLERGERWGLSSTNAALESLVWLYLAAGRDVDAERTVRRLADRLPHRAEPQRGLANVLRKRRRLPEAEAAYRRALQLDPALEVARGELASLLVSQHRAEDVVALYREAVAQYPRAASPRYHLGMTLLGMRRVSEAVAELEQAADLAPHVALYQYNLAVATFMAGRPADALAPLNEAIRLSPDDADAYGFLAVVLEHLGDAEGARAAAERAAQLRGQ